jgi:ABC-type lipoprotein export system ATPase subunit
MHELKSDILFTIKNLECSYNGNDPVLVINSITLHRGKITAVLGASGAGKSTILETLGLMNKTFSNGSDIVFHPNNGQEVSYRDLWKKNQYKELETIRNQHFSFVFQETNLMPNFTAYENVCLGQMFQGKAYSASFMKARETMERLGMADIDDQKKTNELSGGQKQRLAFIRAVTPEYSVLFGDEPTGNLDEKTSEDLMNILRGDVQQKQVSAVIVTHNINLAVRFADVIMIITKSGETGELLTENVFSKSLNDTGAQVWNNYHGKELHNVEKMIKNLL